MYFAQASAEQVSFPEQPLRELDQPGSDRQQAQFGTHEGKDVDSVELVVAVAIVPQICGVVKSVCAREDHVEVARRWSQLGV